MNSYRASRAYLPGSDRVKDSTIEFGSRVFIPLATGRGSVTVEVRRTGMNSYRPLGRIYPVAIAPGTGLMPRTFILALFQRERTIS